jgi:uncharacterized membrane protein YfcA
VSPVRVTVVVLTFFVGGLIKGLTGLGLPPVVLGILTAATPFTASGAFTLHYFRADLTSLLGLGLAVYGALGLFKVRLNIRDKWWHQSAGVLFGATNSFLTGLTGSSAVPGVFYLQSIGLSRDELIQSMGILFTLSTIGLAWSLRMHDLLSVNLGLMSAIALIPALFGMSIGNRIRQGISEEKFRAALCVALLLLGLYIAIQSLLR